MALTTGTVNTVGSLSKALADALEAEIEGFDRERGAVSIEIIANTIVEYFKDNTVVVVPGVATGANTINGTLF